MGYLKPIDLRATRTSAAAAILTVVVQVLMIGAMFGQMGGVTV